MIYDAFIFNDELEVLKIRLEELKYSNVVHVLVESNRTFTGEVKPMYFLDNITRFSDYRILYVPVKDMPTECDAWAREQHQRNAVLRGLVTAHVDDTIILSDVDEIPSSKVVQSYSIMNGLVAVNTPKYNYYLNTLETPGWAAAKIFPYYLLVNFDPQEVRLMPPTVIREGGWHYSWQGDVDRIVNKFRSNSHVECNVPPYNDPEVIAKKLTSLEGLWDNKKYTVIPDEIALTEYVRNNRHMFESMIFKPT